MISATPTATTTNDDSELLDIINENDQVIGQATRSECHSNPNLMHRTVHFTLVNIATKEILLTQRSLKKDHDAGKFCFLGEHITSGETYADALIRGVNEELGFKPSNFLECASHIFKYDTQTELIKFFVIPYDGQNIKYDKSEVETISWIDLNQIHNFKGVSEMTSYWIKNVDWTKALSSEL